MTPTSPLLALRKFLAPEFVFGAGAIELTGRYARNLGMQRALIVTDPGVIEAGWAKRVCASLEEAGLECRVFSDLSPNPRSSEVAAGAEAFREEGCDALVAVGGGSPMDCAKGIGIVASNGGAVLDYEGVDRVAEPMPPMICVPTTGGSASEVSQFTIITDPYEQRKVALVSKALVPDLALVDPETLTTLPRDVSAWTGIDALAHAIEAIASSGGSMMTRMHALEAIRRVSGSLVDSLDRPDDLDLRGEIMMGSLQAGLAFSNASLGAVHAMAHSLGGRKDLPHGECNALILEHVVAFNFETAEPVYRDAAAAMGLDLRGLETASARDRLSAGIRDLRTSAGVHGALGDRGVTLNNIIDLSRNAMRDACMVTNPRRPEQRDIEVIYEEAL